MIETIIDRRVKLKNHVYFGVVPDGVLFDAGETSFVLKDKAAYPLVEKLIALIDGGNPVASILERAPAKLAGFFKKLLGLLAEHGMLLHLDEDAPAARHLVAHRPQNELYKFLEDRLHGQSVATALDRWRDARVIVAGTGQALLSAVRALADSGCAHLTVVPDGDASQGLAALQEQIVAMQDLEWHIRPTLDAIDTADLLVYASDVADPAIVARIEGALRVEGAAGAIGAVFKGRACVIPASRPGHPGVSDLLHWLPSQDDDAASLGPVAMSLLGCVVAQAALCRFFGVDKPASGDRVAIVSASLEVAYNMLVASAHGDRTPASLVHHSRFEMPHWRALQQFEHIKRSLEPWFDPVLGPFDIAADDDIEQVPILQYPVRVRSASDPGQAVVVVGWGLEHGAAVNHGLSQAIEALAQSFCHDAVAMVCEFDEERWQRRALAYAIAYSDEMAKRHHWAWVDLEQLPPGPAHVLYALLRFHAPQGVRAQMQWNHAADAFIVRLWRDDSLLCSVVAAEPLSALTEAIGQACSMYQLQQARAIRFGRNLALPAADAMQQVADWRTAVANTHLGTLRHADFHLLALPGFPATVYCGHASLHAGSASV